MVLRVVATRLLPSTLTPTMTGLISVIHVIGACGGNLSHLPKFREIALIQARGNMGDAASTIYLVPNQRRRVQDVVVEIDQHRLPVAGI